MPQLPNLPSGRALVRRELRATVQRPRTARRCGAGCDVPAAGRRHRTEDVSTFGVVVALLGLAFALYLLLAVGVPDDRPAPPPAVSCYDRVVYYAARLSDC